MHMFWETQLNFNNKCRLYLQGVGIKKVEDLKKIHIIVEQ